MTHLVNQAGEMTKQTITFEHPLLAIFTLHIRKSLKEIPLRKEPLRKNTTEIKLTGCVNIDKHEGLVYLTEEMRGWL